MKIAVPVKYVPDTETVIKIDQAGRSLNPEGVTFVMNPYDEFALEEALRIKEAFGGEVTVVTIGNEETHKVLRTGLAMGADNALFIKCAIPCDATSVAKMLAETLKQRAFDIYFLGMKAVDDDSGVVGPMLAEFLGIPCVTMVTKMEIKDGKVTARRETEMGFEIVETSLPAVFTAQKGLNEPRYASLKGIMLAKKKSIEEITTTQVDNVIEVIEMKYPPARQEGRILGKGVEVVPELVRLLRDEAKIL